MPVGQIAPEASVSPNQNPEMISLEQIPVQTVEPAPLLKEVVDDTTRKNTVWYKAMGRYSTDWSYTDKLIVKETTEHNMLANFRGFLTRKIVDDPLVRSMSQAQGEYIHPLSAEKKVAFQHILDNLQIIGEKELATAAGSIADRLVEDMQTGHPIRLYQTEQGGPRSESFVMMYVKEELKRRNIVVPYQSFTNVSNSRFQKGDRIHFIDDFLVSGNRTGASISILAIHLRKQGYSLKEIQDMIKLSYVAVANSEHIDRGFSVNVDDTDIPLNLFAHYRPNADNELMTGVYTTNDYGFEKPMDKLLGKSFDEERTKRGDPWLTLVHKPYEKNFDRYAPNIAPYERRKHEAFSNS